MSSELLSVQQLARLLGSDSTDDREQPSWVYGEDIIATRANYPTAPTKHKSRNQDRSRRQQYAGEKVEALGKPSVHFTRAGRSCLSNELFYSVNSLPVPDQADTKAIRLCIHRLRCGLETVSHHQTSIAHKLRNEITWARTRLPLRRLVTTGCSRELRREVFILSLELVSRAQVRHRWRRWIRLVANARALERKQRDSIKRLLASYLRQAETSKRCLLLQWQASVTHQRALEEDAACVVIQVECRRWHASRRVETLRRMKRTQFEFMKATCIQKHARSHACRRRYLVSRNAVIRIQRFVRRAWRNRRDVQLSVLRRSRAAKRIQRTYRTRLAKRLQATLHAGMTLVRVFHRVSAQWGVRSVYRRWCTAVESDVVSSVVDQVTAEVELEGSATAIQRHVRGWYHRRAVERRRQKARRIATAWHFYSRRRSTGLETTQARAVYRIQRAFRRHRASNTLYRTFRTALRMRLDGATSSQSHRHHLVIVQSAVLAIQRRWRLRRDVKREEQQAAFVIHRAMQKLCMVRRARHSADQFIGQWLQEACALSVVYTATKWKRQSVLSKVGLLASTSYTARIAGSIRVQRWYRERRAYRYRCQKEKEAEEERAREAVGRLRSEAGMVIQRWCRQRLVRWHEVKQKREIRLRRELELQRVIDQMEEAQAQATRRIQRAWRYCLARRAGRLERKRCRIVAAEMQKRQAKRRQIQQYLAERKQARSAKSTTGDTRVPTPIVHVTEKIDDAIEEEEECTNVQEDGDKEDDEEEVFWSDEYQCSYKYNRRTGESAWLPA